MDSRNLLLPVTLCAAISLLGCQTVKNERMSFDSDSHYQVKQAVWDKNGELFRVPIDSNLKASESRIVVFRHADDSENQNNINISIGRDEVFHTSLQNGYYSEKIICHGSQLISASILDKESGKIVSYSESYPLIPQTTTYLKISLSKAGKPAIQQVSADEALSLLNQSMRQNHQISRVLSNCNTANQMLPQTSLQSSSTNNQIKIKNPKQFNILFDFDSADMTSNNHAVLDGMVDFIHSYPKSDVTLEGHTDSRGSESYNLKLSQSRANLVKDILIDQYGIEAMRLSAIGYGESMPIDTNDTEQGRQNNRRVVATVSQDNQSN